MIGDAIWGKGATVRVSEREGSWHMPKYLITANYTADGMVGLKKDGAAGRRAAVDTLVEGLGGSVECFYFAFGENDAFAIIDMPDNEAAAAAALSVARSPMVSVQTVPLLTTDEIDAALGRSADYRPPGS